MNHFAGGPSQLFRDLDFAIWTWYRNIWTLYVNIWTLSRNIWTLVEKYPDCCVALFGTWTKSRFLDPPWIVPIHTGDFSWHLVPAARDPLHVFANNGSHRGALIWLDSEGGV